MVDNSGTATTTEEARAIIEDVARSKVAFADAFGREAKEEAENGLMEVIQNADDCKFDEDDTPTVLITVCPEHVKIECNGRGFSIKSVQALCRTGQSSKPPGQGYTGEKGLGFKSVFKLAERAHIRSPPYYFRLDQSRELGMITPQWDKNFFDDHEEEYQTTVVLDRICDKAANFSTALEKDIDAIDPVLLLFLRRIERFHLTLFTSSSDDEPKISKCFERVQWTPDSGLVWLKDEDTDKMRCSYKHRFAANFDGIETRRPGIERTDIVLAFPVKKKSGTYVPLIKKANFAFAYLPLGNFGFKFVIQADFLTTSSRQSVDEDSDWNKNIAEAIPRAFEAAISNFNGWDSDLDELATSWPLYLDNNASGASAYWRGISTSITKHLRGAFVVKDRTGRVRKPKHLMFLDWAHDRNGKPMFGQMCDYVSADYPESVRKALLSLGVSAPKWPWLRDKLQELHDEGSLHIKMRSKEWCSDLAKAILETPGRRLRDLQSIPLIPLADGTWRCPPSDDDDPIYFPSSLGATIPPGLSLSLVDEEACACPKRVEFFGLLGVKNCTAPNVIERIIDYHAKFSSAKTVDLIAQLKYLYKMQEHLRHGDMHKIYFNSSTSKGFRRGSWLYADTSIGDELMQLFSGYGEANFLDARYFAEFDSCGKEKLAKWVADTAGVALAPRFIADSGSGLHEDFKWLLSNKSDQVLAILHQYWDLYKGSVTDAAKEALAGHEFMCKSGDRAPLRNTYIPLPTLVEKARAFGDADGCNFLTLPSGEPRDWEYLSVLGVGLDEGLDFYLWVLNQSGFKGHMHVDKSQQLYHAIQSRAFSPTEWKKVKKAFGNGDVNLPNDDFKRLKSCVWHGPKGFSSKPALYPVYGHGLEKLFREILKVPNATSEEALEYLETLRNDGSTSMADVAEVYEFLQKYCEDTFIVDGETAFIAVPALSRPGLQWKSTAQCVWDDDEFTQNGLELESRIPIRSIMERHAPMAKAFFTEVLKLPDAGLGELLDDLALMQETTRDIPKRVYLLYERVDSFRRHQPKQIKHVATSQNASLANLLHRKAFKERPLVFLRGMNGQSSQWVSIEDCVWTRSVLRHKHALMPSLNDYRGLFQDTLEVPNATTDMLVTELLESATDADMEDEDGYHHIKELLQEIARLPPKDRELGRLVGQECWPCRTPTCPRRLCSIGSFYVNDRQDLFDIFSDTHTFLDFDFNSSRRFAKLLRDRGCDSFLSDKVATETEFCGPLEHDHDLIQDFRGRADALVKYLEHMQCESPYKLQPLLENVEVWMSADIKTHYKLESTTVTKSGGRSNVKVSIGKDQTPKLEIYVSTNKHLRSCALVTDVPNQLVAALGLEPSDLQDIHALLQVPRASLTALLIRRGITAGDTADDYEEHLVADLSGKDWHAESDGSSSDDSDDAQATSASSVRSDSPWSAVIETAHASAASIATHSTLRPSVQQRPSARPTTPRPRSQDQPHVPADESSSERSVTASRFDVSPYNQSNRSLNMERLQGFARNADPASSSRPARSSSQSGSGENAFDMSSLREALETTESTPMSMPANVDPNRRRRARLIPNRNEEERARNLEVGFLGEHFVYTLLHDTLELPDFTGEDNWTSSLRSRAGFSDFSSEVSDFTYKDTQGSLTRCFIQMQHSYATASWLSTVCGNGNVPLYRLEVKSTPSQDPSTTFYMSGNQYKLAKKLRVTSPTPSEVYVILRISGLDVLEDGAAEQQPRWTVYLDPYTCAEEGILNFAAPTCAFTAAM